MTRTKRERPTKTRPRNEAGATETPWNVILHNDWVNGMGRLVYVLRWVIPEKTIKRATRIMWTAHTQGKAVVTSCHKELGELHEERLKARGLTATVERGD